MDEPEGDVVTNLLFCIIFAHVAKWYKLKGELWWESLLSIFQCANYFWKNCTVAPSAGERSFVHNVNIFPANFPSLFSQFLAENNIDL